MGQRPAQLRPHLSPRNYWGAELRAARERQNLSLAHLGERIHRDPSYLAKIERGEREIPAHIAEECDGELETGGSLVRLLALVNSPDSHHVIQVAPSVAHVANSGADVANDPSSAANSTPSSALWEEDREAVSVPAHTTDGQVIYVTMSRRELLGGTVAAAGSALATAGAFNAQALPAAALAPEGNPVERFRQMKRVLMESDNLFGASRVIATVQQQIGIMEGLRPGWRGADHRQLVSVQTQFADLLGWLYQDSGDYANAQYWISRSLEWSHVAYEPTTTAFTLARRSQLAADMGHATDAVDSAEAALGMLAHNDSPRVAAIAATFAAHGHALRGDASASARSYEQARENLSRLDSDEASVYGLFFDESYLDVYEGHSMAALDRHSTAASIFETAVTNLPPHYHRDQAVYRAWQALAHAGADDIEQAAEIGLTALSIASETGSARAYTELVQLDQKLEPWSGVAPVTELHTAINLS